MVVIAVGLGVGLLGSLALTRVIGTLLYDVAPNDAGTLTSVAVLLAVVSLAACYVPARRATRVDAIVALRSE